MLIVLTNKELNHCYDGVVLHYAPAEVGIFIFYIYRFFFVLGMSRHIWKLEGPSTYFMDWFDSIKYDLLKIQFLPAVHSSGRGCILDRNGVLWGSFLICSDDYTIFHAGGTGYSEHFKFIKQNVDNLDRQIDLAILPIGNYEVGGMQNIHLTPEEAVRASLHHSFVFC